MPSSTSLRRREFLIDSGRSFTAGWLALQLPFLASLQACAREDAAAGAPFTTLNPAEASTMRAFSAQILPSENGLPGAEQAGAVRFIDRAVGMAPYASHLPALRIGLADLDARARRLGGANGFASLTPPQQTAVMRDVETSDFFKTARMLTIMGTFSDPFYGGNQHSAGWHVSGMEHRQTFQAPFGWYDDPANRGLIA